MYLIACDDPALPRLFNPELPNSPALWAVLLGNYAGTALVDQFPSPTECVLRTNAALTYIGVHTSQSFLNQALIHLRAKGPVWLVWPHRTELLPPDLKTAEIVPRLEFFDLTPGSEGLRRLRQSLPGDLRIQAIDAGLLERCLWRDEMAFYAGSTESFLKHGLGYCLMKADEILAEAYASALGKTRAEIGAITQEAYRGRGYAPIASAFLIEDCRQRGYQAYWSCDADHTASIRVAQKLGFRQPRAYAIYEYPPLAS